MESVTLSYEADGLSMRSHLFVEGGATGPRPGVLVFPEAFGLGEHAKTRAERLAKLGYAALACDLHGDEAQVADLAQVTALIGPLQADEKRTRARAQAALAALVARDEVDATRIAAIGYCFGGTMALELARSGAAIVGAAGFHSGLGTPAPQDAQQIKGKVLACIGADDPIIPPEQRLAFEEEMRAGGVDWQMHLYGGAVHSFTDPAADARGAPTMLRYDRKADERSWATLGLFLDEVFA